MSESLCVVCKHDGRLGKGDHIRVIDGATARVCDSHFDVATLKNRRRANGTAPESNFEVFDERKVQEQTPRSHDLPPTTKTNGRSDTNVPVADSIVRFRAQGIHGDDLREALLSLGYSAGEVNKHLQKVTQKEIEKVLGRPSARRTAQRKEAAADNTQVLVENDALVNALDILRQKRSRLDVAIRAIEELINA